MKNLNELPEKWCVLRTKENYEIINKWFNDNFPDDGGYVNENGYIHNLNVYDGHSTPKTLDIGKKEDFQEITFDQFQMFVMNKTLTKKIKFYVAPYDLFGGMVKKYELFVEGDDDSYVPYKTKNPTKSVPKEIVESQFNLIDPEFNIGDWIYIINSGCNMKGTYDGYVGKLKSIEYIHDKDYNNIVYEFEDGGRVSGRTNYHRLATDQEIEDAKNPLPMIGERKIIDNGNETLTCGCTTVTFEWVKGVYFAMYQSEMSEIQLSGETISFEIVEKVAKYLKRKK